MGHLWKGRGWDLSEGCICLKRHQELSVSVTSLKRHLCLNFSATCLKRHQYLCFSAKCLKRHQYLSFSATSLPNHQYLTDVRIWGARHALSLPARRRMRLAIAHRGGVAVVPLATAAHTKLLCTCDIAIAFPVSYHYAAYVPPTCRYADNCWLAWCMYFSDVDRFRTCTRWDLPVLI